MRATIEGSLYKVLALLVHKDADTSCMAVYEGDTPIHAALTVVLEKNKCKYDICNQ